MYFRCYSYSDNIWLGNSLLTKKVGEGLGRGVLVFSFSCVLVYFNQNTRTRENKNTSLGKNAFNYLSMHICQAIPSALMLENQFFVVDA